MAVTEDRILGGRLVLRQPRAGYRAGMDAALLAAACAAAPGERILELGCGVGGALLAAAVRYPQARFVGVERDRTLAGLAEENIALNDLTGRVGVVTADAAAPFSDLRLEPFDGAIANPPFFDDPGTLRAPGPAKRGAWISDEGLPAWLNFMIAAVRDGGAITVIHRADRLGDLLAALRPRAGSFQIRPVHAFGDAPAKRVIVRGLRRGRAPLRLLPPLVLHDRSGAKHTPQAEAILRGEAALEWL